MMSHKQLHHTDRLTTLTVGLVLGFNNDFVPIDPESAAAKLEFCYQTIKQLYFSV